MRKAALLGGILGLVICVIVLSLYWFGVAGVLRSANIDLGLLFWPSSIMLVGGWRSTIPGIMIAASSVTMNCLMYMALAMIFYGCVHVLKRLSATKDA